MKFKITRDFYLSGDEEEIQDDGADAVAYLKIYDGFAIALGFGGKRQRPDFSYRFKDEGAARAYVQKYFDGQRETARWKADLRQAQREFKAGLQVGDVLVCSWGYDQTNVDFYQVVEVKPSGKTVVIREIASENAGDVGWMCGYCVPVKDKFTGEPMTKRVRKGDYVSMTSYSSAHKWDGEPEYWSSYH